MADDNLYVGADPMDDEDLSMLDRGDNLELDDEEVPSPEPKRPVDDEAEPGEAPEEAVEGEEAGDAAPELAPEEPEEPAESPEAPAESPEAPAEVAPSDPRIPKARFDEINRRRKAAEARLLALEAELKRRDEAAAGGEAFDFDAKEEEYMSAVIDGELEKAKALRREIRAAEQAAIESRMDRVRIEAAQEAETQTAVKSAVARLELEYPQFNVHDPEHYDEAATSEVLALQRAYLATEMYSSPAEALEEAAKITALKYGLTPPAEPEAPPPPAPPPKPRLAPARTPAGSKNKADVARSQPRVPQSGSAGVPAGYSVFDMSESEFDALPESKKRELRGDVL